MFYVYALGLKEESGDRYYVGQTDNISARFEHHLKLLKKSSHHCTGLQEVFNTVGLVGLSFNVLEECPSYHEALDRELFYIKEYASFNTQRPEQPKKERQRYTRRVKHLNTGNIYESMSEAAFDLGLHMSCVRDVCCGKREHASGQMFSYVIDKQEKSEEVPRDLKVNWRKVIRSDGEIFESIENAARSVKGQANNVRFCCQGVNKTHKGFGWQFYTPV